MSRIFKVIFFSNLFLFFFNSIIFSKPEQIEPLKIGNLALPSSQQPGPLIGFGQNMLDKGDLQLFNYTNYLKGENKSYTEIVPSLLYGFTSDFSMYLQLPIALKYKENGYVFRGIQQSIIQFEYSFYNRTTLTELNQISVVANVALSPSPANQNIRRGVGVENFFLGFTASHMSHTWYPFISVGGIISSKEDSKTKYGNQVLYECGLSKNISYKEDTYILNWMIEFDGFYKQQNKICGVIDPNSGSNTLLLGPSIWFSSSHFSLQVGFSGVVYEKGLGNQQNKNKYFLTIDMGYKF